MKTSKALPLSHFEKEFHASPDGQERLSGMARVQAHLNKIKERGIIKVPTSTIKVGIFGDTHHGSSYEDTDALNAYAEECRKEGVVAMLHAGDILEGHRLYRGQEYETHSHGWVAQSSHFAKVSPNFGCPVHFITGNHDVSFKRAAGISVGDGLAALRPDYKFCGEDYAVVRLETPDGQFVNIGLIHPGGGSAYALSYKPQKIVEQIEGGTKPDILCIGNFHKAEWIPSYRNVSVLQVGCFQRQTPFMLTKGLSAMVGGWICEIAIGKGVSSQNFRFINFF